MWIASVGATLTIGSHITHMHCVVARINLLGENKGWISGCTGEKYLWCGHPIGGHQKNRTFEPHLIAFDGSAIINRCGFNSEGILAVARRLRVQHGKRKLDETSSSSSTSNDEVKNGGKAGPGILGVNIGKNKTSEVASADYVQGVHTLSQYADYLVINISSPNTPGLRKLQVRKQLKDLVKKVFAFAFQSGNWNIVLFHKHR